jgi:hypothetical protein
MWDKIVTVLATKYAPAAGEWLLRQLTGKKKRESSAEEPSHPLTFKDVQRINHFANCAGHEADPDCAPPVPIEPEPPSSKPASGKPQPDSEVSRDEEPTKPGTPSSKRARR